MLKAILAFLLFIFFTFPSLADSSSEKSGQSKFAIGSSLHDPNTLKHNDSDLFEKTVRPQQRSTSKSAQGNLGDYLKAHRTDRGRVFEAMIANAANQQLINDGKSARVLVVAAEMKDPDEIKKHPADLLLWEDGNIVQRYQLKSYQNSKDVIAIITQPKQAQRYKNEIIVTHPEKVAEIRQRLSEQFKPLKPRWQKVERALSEGRLTDEVPLGLKVPSLASTQQVTDNFLRKEYAELNKRSPN